jgi:hypothetical protein
MLVDVDLASGQASPFLCDWLVEVPSGNPEPDSYRDTVREIECGGRVFALPGWEETWARVCENGHDYLGLEAELGPGGREWLREEAERRAQGSMTVVVPPSGPIFPRLARDVTPGAVPTAPTQPSPAPDFGR